MEEWDTSELQVPCGPQSLPAAEQRSGEFSPPQFSTLPACGSPKTNHELCAVNLAYSFAQRMKGSGLAAPLSNSLPWMSPFKVINPPGAASPCSQPVGKPSRLAGEQVASRVGPLTHSRALDPLALYRLRICLFPTLLIRARAAGQTGYFWPTTAVV